MFFYQDQMEDIQTLDGSKLEVVTDAEFLRAWIGRSQHDTDKKGSSLEIMQVAMRSVESGSQV